MTRTYLFVRTWVGFRQSFDAHRFDDVDNGNLCEVMTEMSVSWAAEHPDRVRLDPPMDAGELSEVAGWTIKTVKPDRRHATAPMWEVFHVEDDEEAALDVLNSLRSFEDHFRFGPITLRVFPASKFQRAELVDLERQIEWLDDEEIEESWAAIRSGDSWEHPRRLLRREGVARGRSLRRLIAATAKQNRHESSRVPDAVKTRRLTTSPTTRPSIIPQVAASAPTCFSAAALNDADKAVLLVLEEARRKVPPQGRSGGEILAEASRLKLYSFRDADHARQTAISLRKRKWPIPNAMNGTGYRIDQPLSDLCPELAAALPPPPPNRHKPGTN